MAEQQLFWIALGYLFFLFVRHGAVFCQSPYVITKPFHKSQRIIETRNNGSLVFNIFVQINYELERLILGFGESLEVLKPLKLRKRILYKQKASVKNYETGNKQTV